MKIVLSLLISLALTAEPPSAVQAWNGKITRKRHARYVFVFGGKVYDIANQDAAGLGESAGRLVRVTGSLNAGAITVSRIEVPGPVTTTFFIGGVERLSRRWMERVESHFNDPPSRPSDGKPSSVVVSGGYVSRETMAIYLADGVSIDALLPERPRLSAESIAAQHHFGDQVAITCRFLPAPVFDHHHGYERLEVESIRSLQKDPKEELPRIVGAHPFGFATGDNLLIGAPSMVLPDLHAPGPPATSDQSTLDRVRAVNFAYPAQMPNFIAHEIANTYTSRSAGEPQWSLQYTVDAEITVRGGGESRRNIRKNGEPWIGPGLPDFLGYGAWFGFGIRQLFDPHCPNTFELAGTEQVGGKQLLMFKVTSPGGCFNINTGYQTFRPAIAGRALIEDSGSRLVQFGYEAHEFPAAFPLAGWKWMTMWGDVKIGDASYLLPVRSELIAVYSDAVPNPDRMIRVTREYKDYRHFEASSNITFQ